MLKPFTGKISLAIIIVFTIAALLFAFKKTIFSGTREKINDLLNRNKPIQVNNTDETITSAELLKKYYGIFGYQQTWTDVTPQHTNYREMLRDMLNQADSLGLDRRDYHDDYLEQYDSISKSNDFEPSVWESENEVIFTDAAISFLFHIAYGKEISQISFNGVDYDIDSARILRVFNELLIHKNWRQTLDSLEPKTSQYTALKRELNRMSSFVRRTPMIDTMSVGLKEESKGVAMYKLQAYNLLPEEKNPDSITIREFTSSLKLFQQMMGLDTSGTLDKKTKEALSFSLKLRLAQIKQSLNYWRWTGRLKEPEFILVNIPAARLQIVNRDSTKDLSMRVIVGKTENQTPSFTAYITKVITYPYWTVPFSIAVKEMLPKIRKNIGYLEQNNLQVINNKGKEFDPATLPWGKFSQKYFPYIIRQSTGCDNALGVLKFDLNSPFSIYLHDTNNRNLFANKNRFMSHGCVRVEKPMQLAHFILETGLDSAVVAKLDSCMRDQKPSEFKLKKKFPVLLLYMTADVDENNNLKFYKDIYELEEKSIVKGNKH